MKSTQRAILFALLFPFLAVSARAEEGFWPYTALPRKALQDTYGFSPSAAWLDHLMHSSARFDSGAGSGSLISADGLFLTNWHLGKGFVRHMKEGDRYMRDGYYAATQAQELKLDATEIGFPISIRAVEAIEDVTAKVNAVATSAQAGVIKALEDSAHSDSTRGQVVSPHGGALYYLYRYKIYRDIRLVFIPEERIGMFDDPGDGLSPEYPDMFNFDVCIFRIYENGRPIRPKHFLKWSTEPVGQDDLVIGSGDPGASWRYRTSARFAFDRDIAQPVTVDKERRLELAFSDLARNDGEAAKRLAKRIALQDETRRYAEFRLAELQDATLLAPSQKTEETIRSRLPATASAYERISKAETALAAIYEREYLFNDDLGFGSDLLVSTRRLVRLAAERDKPAGERLGPYRDTEAMQAKIGREQTIDEGLERVRITAWLEMLVARLGYQDPLVRELLRNSSPPDRARDAVARTAVKDNAKRRLLAAGNEAATLDDPLLSMVRAIDTEARRLEPQSDALEAEIDAAQAEVDRARYTVFGAAAYPDADNTIRITYGTVSSYTESGRMLAAWSTIGDLYHYIDHQRRRDPLTLPKRWADSPGALDPGTILNFASTLDVVGGSSGTPVVNRKGEFVGVLGESNFGHAASNDFFNGATGRTIEIANVAIIEALRKIYGAENLAGELIHGHR
jgi:hypothetical protein